MGGKMVDFGGWQLPLQYAGIMEEHQRVREAAGLFDVSHMGEITVKGPDAADYLQYLLTNDLTHLSDGQVLYSPLCYPDGGTVDDVLVYQMNRQSYLLVVNAANTEKDFTWLNLNRPEARAVAIEDVSADYAQLALQGPAAEMILQALSAADLAALGFFRFADGWLIAGVPVLISRTGYTGEDGFEIYVDPARAVELWDRLLAAGQDHGLVPCGLGARDTLRLEAALPLYGQELAATISPLEAGLDSFVKLDKSAFIGQDALRLQKNGGLVRRRAGFTLLEPGVARSHYEVLRRGEPYGIVTSGSYSPTLKQSIGLALLNNPAPDEGAAIEVVIRGRPVRASIVGLPFYRKKYKRRELR
jgi:aminomethyltransferase